MGSTGPMPVRIIDALRRESDPAPRPALMPWYPHDPREERNGDDAESEQRRKGHSPEEPGPRKELLAPSLVDESLRCSRPHSFTVPSGIHENRGKPRVFPTHNGGHRAAAAERFLV